MFALAPPDKRIWAWGFRNPWRFWIDPQTDLMWIGDVGETTQEEITVGGKGANHGWPFNEGTREVHRARWAGCPTACMMTPTTACMPPAAAYPRGDGTSVTGGLIPPTGCGWGAYENQYFFGDYNSGRIWTLDVKPRPQRRPSPARARCSPGRASDSIVSFRHGPRRRDVHGRPQRRVSRAPRPEDHPRRLQCRRGAAARWRARPAGRGAPGGAGGTGDGRRRRRRDRRQQRGRPGGSGGSRRGASGAPGAADRGQRRRTRRRRRLRLRPRGHGLGVGCPWALACSPSSALVLWARRRRRR